jgi:hypothetical protein
MKQLIDTVDGEPRSTSLASGGRRTKKCKE